ncbi:fibronectin type III domain-containing protein [Hymenobacter sp. ASUV-10]|uniref:Fibronectin type III domain-containing protein n=1 Tax=Hymenobacter aranciens TaxID=3063996 RepID=A0ABT9BB07_9BACT|nr:fibronectin type III domain-containing protein [Hymenobacter sp. ASUV-10]MDO7875460.1 fibronectin type III domain-containing protein [Hymenobacter sp. ASUV-10]
MKQLFARTIVATGWWRPLGLFVLLLGALGARAQQRAAPAHFIEDAGAQRAAAVSPLAAALQHSRPLTLDVARLQATLATAPSETQPGATPLLLALPLPDGTSEQFRVVETAVMEPGLAAQFPGIKTYRGVGVDDPTASVRLDLTPGGFHAQILSDRRGTVYIDPVTRTDTRHYLSFARTAMPASRFSCGVAAPAVSQTARRSLGSGPAGAALRTSGGTLRSFQLAVAATGEYTAFHGGTVALGQAAIVTSVNRVVGVFEKELAVRLVLVNNNSSLVYTNASTDPYTDNDPNALLSQNQSNINSVIGVNNYDIGHVFSTGGGGVAQLRSVCGSGKAQGVTGSFSPVGDAFDIDYVAHEMGHQFGGNHTFNADGNGSDACDGNRNASTAYEPGSGTTIMAYAGICGTDNNTQNNSNAYFHVVSYEEIQAFLGTISCADNSATGNTPPTVATLPASGKVLPIGTPFKLTALGSDADGDAVTYCWEEYDLGSAGTPTATQVANDDVPLFRSFVPSSSPTRYFPQLTYVISNSTPPKGERLPLVTRDLNFRVTLRDHYTTNNTGFGVTGGVNSSTVVALSSTSAAGPFLVTAPNTAVTWAGNTSQTVTWNVAGTSANGVNCATVNILLSTDGGFTYPTVLLAGTANDGSAAVTVPSVATTTARVMVEAADNYFFDISNTNFTITAATACAAPTGLSVGSITAITASLSFTASGSATSYVVTTSPATTTQTVTASPVTLTGLTGGTSYTVFVQSSCAAGATSTAAATTFTTAAPPVCNAVSNAAVGSITATSASLSFTASAGASTYVITTSPTTSTYTVTASPVALTGLTAGTSYTVNIQTNCSNGGSATASITFGTPPANDNCAGAIQLISGTSCTTTAGSVTGATQSQAASTCNGATSTTALDVWYSFVATGTTHTVTLNSPGFDGVVQAFGGSCGSLSSLGCRDQNAAGTETLSLTGLTANTRYYIRVYPYDTAPTNGSFTLCVTGTVAPTCAAPTALSAGSITNTSAGISFTPNAQASSYTVTTSPATTTQTITASPASLTGLTPGTSYTVSIATSCQNGLTSTAATTTFATTNTSPCAAPTSLTAGSVTSTSATVSFTPSASATSYTVTTSPATTTQTVTGSPVSFSGLTASTAYTVSIVSNCAAGATAPAATTSFTTSVAVPANDECAGAVLLTSATSCSPMAGTITGATQSRAPLDCNGFTSTTVQDVWYAFVATGTTHTITAASSLDGVLELFSGTCGSLSSLGCADGGGQGTTENLTLSTLTSGSTYYVRFYPYTSIPGAVTGSFTICVTNPVPPCTAPTALTTSNQTSTSVTVGWTASPSATSYTVTYTPNGGSAQTVSPNPTGTAVSLTGLTPGTNYTVSVASNCAGGATSGAAQTFFFTYAVPVVTSVLIPNGTYLLGQTLPVGVVFNQNLTVTGSPTLALTIGSTVRQAALDATNTSGTQVSFAYVIQAGDLDTDGITLGAISLNGGTIRSGNGTDANLTLNNVPNTSTILVDGIRPTTLSSIRLTPAAAITNGSSVTFRVTFSEAVLNVDVNDFTIGNLGSVSGTIASVSGSGTTYDVVVNNLSGAGDFRLNVTAIGTAIRDVAGNGVGSSNTFFGGEFYTLDQAAPNTTIDNGPAATTTSTSATFTFSGTDGAGSGVSSFQGSLDGAAFATVVSPLTFTGLSVGPHTFQVRAVDAAGNVDPTPATATWTITAPTPAPGISSLSPTSGPVGTSVTITGTSLTSATAVSFNGTAAPGFTVNSATSITATVPAGASTGSVTVTTPSGTSNGLAFTVTLPDLLVTTTTSIPASSYNNVTVTSTGTLTLTGALSVAGTMTVQSGGTFITNYNLVQGGGSFALEAGGNLHVFDPAGLSPSGATGSIRNTGARSFSDDASYTYRGTQAQQTGPGLPATVRNLTVNNPGGVTLSGNVSIREALTPAAGTFTTTGRVLTLLSTASSTAYVASTRPSAGSISGPITAQRYVDGSLNSGPGYRHFSAPVTNTSFADLAAGSFAPVVNAAYNSAAQPGLVLPYPTVFGYDQTRLASTANNLTGFDKGWFSPAALSETMSSGQGYTVHAPAGITIDFVGTPAQTDFSKANLGRGTDAQAGWHLLGNPYPAPLHWDSLLAHGGLSGLENALYVFKSSGAYAGSYASYVNGIGANNGGPVLPLGQGFFVRTATVGGSGQLTFRNTDRLNTSLAPAFQRSTADARPQLRLALSGPASAGPDETVVYFENGATATGPDAAHDAPKLTSPGARLSLASQMPGHEPLAINGLPLTGAPVTSIPLTLRVPAAGPYHFDVLDLRGFDANAPATLLDHQLNTRTDLRQVTNYAFTAAQAGALNGRFELLLSRPTGVTATAGPGTLQFSVWPNPASHKAALHVQLEQATTATVMLRDVLGRAVAQHSFSGLRTELTTTRLAAGTYLLTVQAAGQAPATRRVVVE